MRESDCNSVYLLGKLKIGQSDWEAGFSPGDLYLETRKLLTETTYGYGSIQRSIKLQAYK